MIVGTTLFKMDGTAFYSPEFPRGGLGVTFAFDVTHLVGSPTVTFDIETRNSDETSFTSLASDVASSVGVLRIDTVNVEEIVRIKVSFDAGDAATDGVHFLIQAPSWRPY